MTARSVLLLLSWCISAPIAAATVAENYMSFCASCHLPGIAGAPKVGDREEWTRRMRAGFNSVYRNTLEGMPNTMMAPKGGQPRMPDEEIRAIVDYMIGAAGLDAATLEAAGRYDKLRITDRDFLRLDRNFDGAITRDEIAHDAVLTKHFARFDANKDGRLNEAEYRHAEATLEKERSAVSAADDDLVKAIRAVLAKVSGVDLRNTKVEVQQGTAAIIGIVEDAEVARRAQDLVKRIDGVKKIDNRLVSGHQLHFD